MSSWPLKQVTQRANEGFAAKDLHPAFLWFFVPEPTRRVTTGTVSRQSASDCSAVKLKQQ